MDTPQELAERFAAVWNERVPERRRKAIEELWMPQGIHYVNTLIAQGYEALERRIAASHEKNVRDNGNIFRACKDARRLQDVVTFTWEMVPAGSDDVLAIGLEFLRLDAAGQIVSDYQFITK
jgi:hypothetical protein